MRQEKGVVQYTLFSSVVGPGSSSSPHPAAAEHSNRTLRRGKNLRNGGSGEDLVKDKKFLTETGATMSSIDGGNLKGMTSEYKRTIGTQGIGGPVFELKAMGPAGRLLYRFDLILR